MKKKESRCLNPEKNESQSKDQQGRIINAYNVSEANRQETDSAFVVAMKWNILFPI